MTGYISYYGIPCECGQCGAKVSESDRVSMHVFWANQHGAKVRIFCRVCGHWTDRKMTASGETVRVFEPADPWPY